MDQIVRTVVWISLFGGTGVVLLIVLPRIVIRCLEIVESIQITRTHRKNLFARPRARFSPPEEPPRAPSA